MAVHAPRSLVACCFTLATMRGGRKKEAKYGPHRVLAKCPVKCEGRIRVLRPPEAGCALKKQVGYEGRPS